MTRRSWGGWGPVPKLAALAWIGQGVRPKTLRDGIVVGAGFRCYHHALAASAFL